MSSINTEQLMGVLEKTKLLPPPVFEELKRRVSKAPAAVDPRSVTKWLVVNKHITVAQSLDLLAGKPVNRSGKPSKPSIDEELGLAEDVGKDLEVVDDDVEVLGDEDLEEVSENLQEVSDELETIEEPAPKAKPAPKSSKPRSGGKPPPVAKPLEKKPLLVDELAPLGGGPAGDPLAAGAGGARLGSPGRMRLGGKAKAGQGKNVWDSPFMLIGGGGLLAMLILAAALYWSLGRTSGEDALQLAEEDYKGGSYSQAISKYEQYLQKFPDHKGVSTARVHRGLAQMRQAADSSGDWSKTLEICKQVIDEIATEREFPEARAELAALLPRVAAGLADKASTKPAEATILQSEEALALIDKNVLSSLKPEQQMQDIRKSLALARKELARGESLTKAIAAIKAAQAEGNPAAAYAVRKELLKSYPDLTGNRPLQDAILAVSQSEIKNIVFKPANTPAQTSAAKGQEQAAVTLVTRTPGSVAGAQGRMTYALAEGAAYGLEAQSGRVAWRRFLGFDARHPPVGSQRGAGPLAIMVDAVAGELACVTADNGALKWRQPLPGPADAEPLVLRDRVVQAAGDGSLAFYDLESGTAVGSVKIPHRLTVPPAVDQREQRLYQLADDSTLYILSIPDGRCEAVVYLGHESGTIRTPPLLVSRYLIVAENHLSRGSRLRVFLTDEKGLAPKQIQELPLDGHVYSPPQMVERTLIVATDLGAYYAFNVGGVEKKEPFTRLAAKPATDAKGVVRHCLSRASEFWVGDTSLTRYDVQAAQGRLTPKWVKFAGDVILQPLESVGDALISVRRRAGTVGAVVSAVSMADGAPLWETLLASPLAGSPAVDAGGSVTAMNLAGGLFRIPSADVKTGVLDSSSDSRGVMLPPPPKEGASLTTPEGNVVFSFGPGSTQGMLAEKGATSPRVVSWPAPLAVAPTAYHGGLLMPAHSGQVLLLDSLGRPAAEPFQPRLESGVQLSWKAPSVGDDGEVVISDGGYKLYRLGFKDQPRANLAMLGQADLKTPIASPTAVLGTTLYFVDDADMLQSYALPALSQGKEWDLKSQAAWGPARAGNAVLLATSDDQLLCLNGNQELVWKIPLTYGALSGTPLATGDKIVFSSVTGAVWSASAADGAERAKLDLAQPLSSGPVLGNEKLIISGHDGTLHVVNVP